MLNHKTKQACLATESCRSMRHTPKQWNNGYMGPTSCPLELRHALYTHKKCLGLPWWSSGWECLPAQGTQVWSLVREDATRHGGTKPKHNYWANGLEPMSRAHMPQLLKAVYLCSATKEVRTMRSWRTTKKSSPCSSQLEKACMQQQKPSIVKKK